MHRVFYQNKQTVGFKNKWFGAFVDSKSTNLRALKVKLPFNYKNNLGLFLTPKKIKAYL